MIFLGKQNTKTWQHLSSRGGVGVPRAALRAKNPESKSHRLVYAKWKPSTGSLNQKKGRKKNVQSNVNNQGYNDRSKRRLYTLVSTLVGSVNEVKYHRDDYLQCLEGSEDVTWYCGPHFKKLEGKYQKAKQKNTLVKTCKKHGNIYRFTKVTHDHVNTLPPSEKRLTSKCSHWTSGLDCVCVRRQNAGPLARWLGSARLGSAHPTVCLLYQTTCSFTISVYSTQISVKNSDKTQNTACKEVSFCSSSHSHTKERAFEK